MLGLYVGSSDFTDDVDEVDGVELSFKSVIDYRFFMVGLVLNNL